MSRPSTDTIPRGALPALDRAFDRVSERLHLEEGMAAAQQPGARSVNGREGLERVLAASRLRGLAGRVERVSVREVADLSGPESPAMTALDPEGETWIIVWGSSAGSLRTTEIGRHTVVDSTERVGALANRLGTPADRPREWILLQPAAPLHAGGSQGHGHATPQRRLWELLQPERRDLLRVVEFAVGVGLLGLATPVAVQAVVNSVAMGGIRQPLFVLAIMLFVFLAFSGLLRIMQQWLVEIIQRRIFARISADLAWRLPRVTQAVHDRSHGAELVNRFFEVMTVQKASATLLLDGVATLLQAVIGLVVLAFYHPFLLVFDVVLILCLLAIVFLLGRGATETAIAESRAKYAVAGWLEAVARNHRTFKLYGGPEYAEERTDLLSHSYLHARERHYRVVFRQNASLAALSAVAGTAILAIGGLLVMEGQLTLGQLVAAELIVTSVLSSFSKFGKQLESYYDLLAGADKLGHLVDLPLESEGTSEGAERWDPNAISVEVRELEFSHEDSDPLFRGLSFSIGAGERVAIVGAEGSGKGTLAELLVGLRTPSSGSVRLNGFDLRELRLDQARARISLVSDPEILEDTIVENVRLGRPGVEHEDVVEALEATGLLDSLRALPDGLQTRLVPGGSPLSGGQVQRLLVARALIGPPGLVIVDALLDDLDDREQIEAMDALVDPRRRFTLILLTRSTALARRCDRVIRLSGGRAADPEGGPR